MTSNPARGSGIGQRLGVWVAVGALFVPLLGYVYSTGRAITSVENRLDRNCRILATIQANTRFIIVDQASEKSESDAFREIFERALVENC